VSLLKPDPKSCIELECLVDNMEESPYKIYWLFLALKKNLLWNICLLDNLLYLIILIVYSCDETKYFNNNVGDEKKSNEFDVLSVPNITGMFIVIVFI